MKKTPKELKDTFKDRVNALNKEQERAVEAIEGPVMVIAGPGTGKTEILTLRIANILKKTDTPASGILALTFTNSGVRAMRERLLKLIGSESSGVTISTFHSFGISLISEFYEDLNLPSPPTLLDDNDRITLFDELLENNPWQYLRGRSGGSHNFGDLRSVISLLKQERMSAKDFLKEIEAEVKKIKEDPASYSSRGSTKGELKSTESERIERFERTREIASFYELYEKTKKERDLADYDDILEYIVELVKRSENARASIRERYLYVLVDEHQDSSGVQNEFLEEVWRGVERPNIFVVGDDRQLIYGFGGASLSHFQRFQKVFPDTELITLIQNYRSTQTILDTAHELLQSSLVETELKSQSKEKNPIYLVEAEYPRDEILRAGLEIKRKIKEGVPANECAILVPKNSQVKSAVAIITDMGLQVASGGKTSFFSLSLTQSLLRFLKAISDPSAQDRLANILLDSAFDVPFLASQVFLREHGPKISLEKFKDADPSIKEAGQMIEDLASQVLKNDVYTIVQKAANELFFKRATTNKALTLEVEVTRTMLHLALNAIEKNHKITLDEFVEFIERLETYGQDIPLAVFSGEEGVQVKTLHQSKGLEFDFVWIAHMDEASLMKGRTLLVTLPSSLKEKITQKDQITAKRELFVGITRAKRFCTLSYSKSSYSGATQYVAKIISELPENILPKKTASDTEKELREANERSYIEATPPESTENTREEVINLVKNHYSDRPVSVTHLNNFFSCPWKWYFRNFLQLPEPITESLQFGDLMHSSIESIIKNGSDIQKIMSEKLDELRIYDEKKRERFLKDGEKVLERFTQNYLKLFSDVYSEKRASSYRDPDISEIEVGGKIDIVQFLPDKTIAVTDFKTGKVKTSREIEKLTPDGRMSDLLRQLAMYSYLLSHDRNLAKRESRVSLSQLLFLEADLDDKNTFYKTTITEKEISLLKKDLKDFVELVSSGKWVDCPCDFSPYGVNKQCEYCAFAENLQIKNT